MEQARARGADAWERLVALYQPLLDVWLGAAGLQEADRDDVRQRVLTVLVKQLPEFKHSGRVGAFRAWLRGIVTNLLREHWRTRPTPATESFLAELVDPQGSMSRLWDEQHDKHVLQGLMKVVRPEFADKSWLAFRRIALDGAAARDVAAELELSVNAVLIAKSRILARLRQAAEGLVE